MVKLLVVTLFCLISTNVSANEDSQFAEIARLRQYAGGADESDLKVQLNLKKTKKKKQPTQEPSEGF